MANDQLRKWVQNKLDEGISPRRVKKILNDMDKDPEIVDKVTTDELASHPAIKESEKNQSLKQKHQPEKVEGKNSASAKSSKKAKNAPPNPTSTQAGDSIIERNKPDSVDEIEEMPHDIELSTSVMEDPEEMHKEFGGSVETKEEPEKQPNRDKAEGSEGKSSGSDAETVTIGIPKVNQFEVPKSQLKIVLSLFNTLVVGIVLYYVFVSG